MRVQISKRARFEVFKRDSFRCQYCGQTPPEVTLEVDHIIPVAGGGGNDDENLVTSCQDCNRGKSDVPLSSVPRTLQERAAEAQEREEQIRAQARFLQAARDAFEDRCWDVAEVLQPGASDGYSQYHMRSVRMFVKRIGYPLTLEAAHIAANRWPQGSKRFKYFCGVC
jgi:hypothetical protein